MCGILFFFSKKNRDIINDIILSLELIQNRGYDSMGICYYDNSTNEYKIVKHTSTKTNDCYELLKLNISKNNIQSHFALGHTRWATHGAKSDINSHPHISQNKKIILVHNGIINNFNEIKMRLQDNGYNFYSQTDTEVIANLIEYNLLTMNIEDAIKKTIDELEGTWALVIIYTEELDTCYITRQGSPLLLGINENYIICTSEIDGFNGLIYNYITLCNHDIIKIADNKYRSINNCKDYNINQVLHNDRIISSKPYDHWMLKEIMEQPESIQKAYNYGARILNNNVKLGGLDHIKDLININAIQYVYIIGCGTSYNAGLIAEKYFKSRHNFLNVFCINACEFTENDLPNIICYQNNTFFPCKSLKNVLCIFLSQSGETIDVYNCLKICKHKGCLTIGIINKVDSLIAREVDSGVYLNAGSEISVASTKSFTSMIVVLSLVQMWFNNCFNNTKIIDSLRLLPNTLTNLLFDSKFLDSINNTRDFIIQNNIQNIFILGKNKLYPVACEGSLKIKEVCYIHAEGFSAGSLKHGPFALLDNTNLTILLIDYNDEKNYNNLKSTYYEIISRETNIIVITNSHEVINELNIQENNYIMLYKLNNYNEILFTIALQKLAYTISVEKGINPDKPRNLAKVVTVE